MLDPFSLAEPMHPIRRLIQHFESQVNWPIEPADVQKWVTDNGFCDEFIIHYVECDPRAFDGIYVERQGAIQIRHAVVYGEPIIGREIFVNTRQPEGYKRLAEVKETLHILDMCSQRTNTKEGVNSMISYAATRLKLPTDDGSLTDIMAVPQALAILFPWKMRELLKDKYDAGLISAEELAQTAKLPVAFVELVLSERWEAVHHIMEAMENGFEEAAE